MIAKKAWFVTVVALSGCLAALAPAAVERLSLQKTLSQVVAENPYTEYAEWWALGEEFSRFMSQAIVSEWSALPGQDGDLDEVKSLASEYVRTVYHREVRASVVDDFVERKFTQPLQSGEFDALSYAFFRSAFELMKLRIDRYDHPLDEEQRLFTKRVGSRFFGRIEGHLGLDLPSGLVDEASFATLRECIGKVGEFLNEQGYCRDHVAFRFDVDVTRQGKKLVQPQSRFLESLERDGEAYALYEMGYPAILPSAVYLFHTLGEAQHHSSRTIEELFDRVGLSARESADFDPTGYPSDMVVEFWEISKKP